MSEVGKPGIEYLPKGRSNTGIVQEVIAEERPQTRFSIKTETASVIQRSNSVGVAHEVAIFIGENDQRCNFLGGTRKRRAWYQASRENATGRSICRRTTRKTIRFTTAYRVAEALRQHTSPIAPLDRPTETAGVKLSVMLGLAGNLNESGTLSDRLPRALIIDKRKDLIMNDRTAQRASESILMVKAATVIRGRVVVEEIARIELLIPQEFERRSMKFVGPGLRDHVDDATAEMAVLSIEVISQETELGDRIEVGNDRCTVRERVASTAAIHLKIVCRFALITNRNGSNRRAGKAVVYGCRRRGRHSRLKAEKVRAFGHPVAASRSFFPRSRLPFAC